MVVSEFGFATKNNLVRSEKFKNFALMRKIKSFSNEINIFCEQQKVVSEIGFATKNNFAPIEKIIFFVFWFGEGRSGRAG